MVIGMCINWLCDAVQWENFDCDSSGHHTQNKVSAMDSLISKLNDENYPVLKISNSTVVCQLPYNNKLNCQHRHVLYTLHDTVTTLTDSSLLSSASARCFSYKRHQLTDTIPT